MEREPELIELDRLIDALRNAGTGAAVLIEGVPGIGKTALMDAVLSRERRDGLTVLRACGSELDGGLVFGGVRQLLAEAVLALDGDDRDALLSGPAGLAGEVLGVKGVGAAHAFVDPLYGLYWLVAGLAERGPLVLGVDDLHWLDEESGRFVGYLAQRLEGLPVLLVATARSPEPGVHSAAEAAQSAFTTVIRPRALSVEATGAMLAARPPEEVHRLSGGNPLLVVELRRALAAAPTGTPLDELGSATVARLVLDRVAKVSPAAGPLARAVSLFAAGAELEDASAVAELDEAAAAEAADGLIAVQVFADAERLAFVHPMMRTAVYEQLGPFARRRGHAQAADRLKARGAPAEEIAAHLLAAKPAGDPENLRILRAAADQALRALAPRAAARYLERAIAEPPSSRAERVAMLRELGNLQVRIAHPGAQATLRAALDQTADPRERADVAIELAVAAFAAGRYGEAATSLVRLRESTELDPERGLVADSVILASAFESRSHPELIRAAMARLPADLPGDTAAQRLALHWLGWTRLEAGAPASEVAESAMRRAGDYDAADLTLTLGVEIGDPSGLLVACGELDTALALAQERADRARELGVESVYADARLGIGIIAVMRGDLRDAEATFRLALETPGVQPHIANQLERWLLTALTMQGRLDEAEALLATMAADTDSPLPAAQLARRRAEIAVERGDYAAAVEPFERVFAQFEGASLAGLLSLQDHARALHGVGRTGEAVAMMRQMLSDAERSEVPVNIGTALMSLGRMLPGAEGRAHLQRAYDVLWPTQYRWDAARAALYLGAAMRRDGERVEARPLLRAALDYAERAGAAPIAEQAREDLRLAGSRPRSAVLTGFASLTPAEARIARLVAAGRTNKEVAQQLFLTVRTVESHLYSAYRKLDIKSRRDLAATVAAEAPVAGDG